ncbi:hypothetical protein Ahy_A02g006492 [Arachis hypogaea]|uniref:Uncharacterized protein n=1 Tax=Arachis hypogaea TaxID=3818 RepID=A0A445E9Z5_ARAHY|nr:hypothetical protein Ahy_A02g006492 [Arachis hypogaea]
MMNIISWNCRVQETHISGSRVEAIKNKTEFDSSFMVEANGHLGDIWCLLVDLGYLGWPYTWRRGNLVERLDRGLSNLEWQLTFSEDTLKHLSMFKSNHVPLCLQLFTVGS